MVMVGGRRYIAILVPEFSGIKLVLRFFKRIQD